MQKALLKHKWLSLFFTLLFVLGSVMAQERDTDTVALINKHRKEAIDAIHKQDFEEAMTNLDEANKLALTSKDKLLKSDIRYHIAELHYHLQNFQKALEEINKSIVLLETLDTDTENEIAKAYTLKGLILLNTGAYEKAELFLKDAYKIFINLNNEAEQGQVVSGLGQLELKKGNYKTAINYFDAAIPLLRINDFTYKEAEAHLKKAEAFINLDSGSQATNLRKAQNSLHQALVLIDANAFKKLKAESYKIISYIALKENNFKKAEENLSIYEKQKEALYKTYMEAVSKGVDVESNVGDLNEIIATQKDDLDKKQKSIKFTQMTTGLSIALIVILSLLTLSLYKNNNLRAKANNLLKDKNTELQMAKEKAERASLAKAQFLSTITHELRTPLYAVTGLTHLLLEENPKEHQREHLNSLKFSGEYLLSLINNILDLNKLEANKVELERTSFNLKKRIDHVLIALKKSADDKNNTLHLEFDENIPQKMVGDPLKLSQVLINLIGNSLKFTQNGDVTVRVQRMEQQKNKVKLHFEIEDNGVGISRKKQKSIFETFSQGSLQINRKFGGTGLGLSIVKNLLELMNSKINLESQLGKGSKFWFNITLAVPEEAQEDKNKKTPTHDVDYATLENKSILVVEDNKINQMITKKILEKNNMHCEVADNGMDAIKLVKEHTFDVILMDIHMPGISGIEATQKIRDFDKQIPIIALTAVTVDENLDDFYRAGFNDIIPKPFKTEEFFEKIYRTIKNRKAPVDS
ncbi:tetratricopeptide repeat-containing hybrid sensor histidine kinase/response regulator [Marixanthomonas spongiae]|uniref:histidine kinase n=1 Tax=Marixanthomonas spongiae TaxID=2174845 RepID=A0A2U0I7B7_9FLAO|nr:response regulator [Marixanthomonas spongiae]PVW16996.1 hybrid sensor histidine kinase/response regulator [Marixanthomonas spongiae]